MVTSIYQFMVQRKKNNDMQQHKTLKEPSIKSCKLWVCITWEFVVVSKEKESEQS